MMSPHNFSTRKKIGFAAKQQGVVLFFALIALVVMSLAAVALIRSVDTSTIIAGNLSFRQSAAAAGDTGGEAALGDLDTWQAAMALAAKKAIDDSSHVFNQDNAANGYYSSYRTITQLTDGTFNWNNSKSLGTDIGGNTVRYIIERMCSNANDVPRRESCMLTSPLDKDNNEASVKLADAICDHAKSSGCPVYGGFNPYMRITARVTSAKNTVSYIQSFAY